MFRFSNVAQGLAILGAVSAAGSALAADSIYIDNFVYTGTHSTYSTTIAKSDVPSVSPEWVYAGEMNGKLNGNSFQTFCADIFQTFPGWGSANVANDYALVSGATKFGSKATDVNKLFTNWYGSATTEAKSTAFQLALWEIIYESGAYDVGTGTFTAKSLPNGSATAAIYADANNMLSNLGTLGSTYTQVDVYQSTTKQDFTTISVVPEPESYALAVAGLGVVGFAMRRRRVSRAVA